MKRAKLRQLLPIKTTPIILMFIALGLFSCQKPAHEVPEEKPDEVIIFMEGKIQVWMNANVSTAKTFEVMNNYGLVMYFLRGFDYQVDYPADSMEPIKNYLWCQGLVSEYECVNLRDNDSTKIFLTPKFHNMDSMRQKEWLRFVDSLKLIEIPPFYKELYLEVPVGDEKLWIDSLIQDNCIRAAFYVDFFDPILK